MLPENLGLDSFSLEDLEILQKSIEVEKASRCQSAKEFLKGLYVDEIGSDFITLRGESENLKKLVQLLR